MIFKQLQEGHDLRQLIHKLQTGGLEYNRAVTLVLAVTIAYLALFNGAQFRLNKWGSLNNYCLSYMVRYEKGSRLNKHYKSGRFVHFVVETVDSYNGYQLTERQSENHDKTGTIGKNYKN